MAEAGGAWTRSCHPALCVAVTDAAVGVSYPTLELRASTALWTADYANAKLTIVDGDLTTTEAQNGDCLTAYKDTRYVHGLWGAAGGVNTTPNASTLAADTALMFRMGGSYRLCYSANGTFGLMQADVAKVKIDVNGVYDTSASCNTETCLADRRYECYLMKNAFNTADGQYGLTTSCILDYSYAGAGYFGPPGLGTWSAEFQTSSYNLATGEVGTVTYHPCSSSPAGFICSDGGACDAGDAYISPDANNANRRIDIPTTRPDITGEAFRPRSVAACYCPARGGCDESAEFIQQIGIMHFYLSKVCHAKDLNCALDRNGVTSQYRFKVRVECPTDACQADNNNRVKLVAHLSTNDKPSWDTSNTCGSATHGIIEGVNALPLMTYTPIDGTAGGNVNEPVAQMSGGTRQDYKMFGGSFGFRFKFGVTGNEARNFHQAKIVDVCYCNSDCGVALNWFKVGALRVAPTRLVSAATSRSSLPAQWAIEYVNQPGIVGLERPYEDADVLGLQEAAILKLVSDNTKTLSDDGCAWMGYSSQLVTGPSDIVAASLNFLAQRQTQTPLDLKKLVFNTDSFVNTITVKESGTIAVCYCGITVDNTCVDPGNWKLITHVQIRGPQANQRWLFSTNVVFRFSFEGYGLGPDDSLRIISSDGRCTDNNYNPNTAAFAYTSLQVKCPVPCNAVTPVDGTEIGDLPTSVLTADTWNCDRNNSNCQTNDITEISVVSETETEITFQYPPGFLDADELTLGENIDCDVADPVCTPEALQALKGVFDFADRETNTPQAPETYMVPHRLLLTSNVLKVRLQVGWPSPAPRFIIAFAGARPEIGYIGRGGKWTHHSRAITREEILGTAERANLRVCWKYGGNGGKYVAEVGLITIRNPAPMEGNTFLSMSTTRYQQVAPMVITFQTATGVTGQRYDDAVDSLRLKILFTRTDLVDIVYSDLAGTEIPYDVPSEDDAVEATQAICGKLFLELWSDDMERGFPLPRGCYYKGYPTGNMREVFMVFEGKSGLQKNTIYQIVFNGIVKDYVNVVPGGQYMELFPMDDINARPYEAIERGITSFTNTPQLGPVILSDPRFRCVDNYCDGFKIVGGNSTLLELKSGDSIVTEIMGDPTAGRIMKTHIIRIFLWPLTQWQTTSSCTAECITGSEVSFQCAPIERCEGLPVVPGMSLNVLRITLPDPFEDLHGNVKVRIRIGGITIPSGGFFPSRLAAQVTKTDDSRPHYVLSVGDYIWKEPNLGQTVARVVSPEGGANLSPFRGEKDNILYARLMLSSTILARDDIGVDASFTITLPPGYTCLDKNDPTDPTFANPWEAETTLPAFGSSVPQGRGTPHDGTPTHGWSVNGNECIFRPAHPNGVIFAGSSMVVKIHVDNPTSALQRSDTSNLWTLHMTNKGLHTDRQVTQKYPFLSPTNEFYQTNNAVLGKLQDTSCQPTSFAPSTRRAVEQELRFFMRTEQQVGSGGLVRVFAPAGFSFGAQCNASDLEAPYYATEANPGDATLPLPNIANCTTVGLAMGQADIRLSNILYGGRLFGFKLRVENPQQFDLAQKTGWRIFTVDRNGFLVDGTPGTVPFTAGDDKSWGVYSGESLTVFIRVPPDDMLPFAMTNTRARVTVLLEDIPAGDSGWMRFIAPQGYIFDFTDAEFNYDPAAAGTTTNAIQVQPPLPRDGSNVIIFRPMTFAAEQTYAFTALARIPDRAPTTASNTFFFELGFNSSTTDDRKAAAVVPAPPVRALKNANVDYITTVASKENTIQFQLETVTSIPEGGGIEIVSPEGFIFDGDCELVAVRDPAGGEPPPLRCFSFLDPSRGPTGQPVVTLTAGVGGLAPGLYRFGIIVENPAQTSSNYAADTLCGTIICWSFETFVGLSTAQAAAFGPLDYMTHAQGFSIQRKMLEAQIPFLTEEQRRATGRDDRPVQPNAIIFAFKLDLDARASGELLLRGPYGFEFAEECIAGVEVSEGTVFGLGNRFPREYAVWPTGVQVSQCRGSGADARLTLEMSQGAFLEGSGALGTALSYGALYLFRIGIATNPATTPTVNRWSIELNGEASEAIEGFQLWAFTRTSLVPVATARDRTLAGEVRTPNPLRISFRPSNAIATGGQIRALAPVGFQFVSLPSRQCDVQLSELPYSLVGINYPGYEWPEDGLVCLVDRDDPRLATVTLQGTRGVSANLDYVLILTVYNPATGYDPGPTVWTISSYNAMGQPLDESRVESFVINPVMNLWAYTNPDPENSGQEVQNGGARLPEFTLQMRFPDPLESGDIIEIHSPAEFRLSDPLTMTDAVGRCPGFRWVGPPGTDDLYSPLPRSTYRCNTSSITFVIDELEPVARDFLIEFGLGELYNPLRTPARESNFWRCVHYAVDAVSGTTSIRSSKAFQGWTIIPQLENVDVQLIGPNLAAESVSAIRVAFTAVTAAEDLAIRFASPSDFNFDAATTDASDQVIFLRDGSLVRIRMQIAKDQRYTITLRGVTLGREGGQTDIDLTTWTGGLFQGSTYIPGTKQDERLSFRGGFRLPGSVVVRYEKLENIYHRDRVTYPVQSSWQHQMGRPAFAEFRFLLTRPVGIGEFLSISAPPYEPTSRLFQVIEAIQSGIGTEQTTTRRIVQNEVVRLNGNELRTKLLEPMIPYQLYEVTVSVIAPNAVQRRQHGAPIYWTIETTDGSMLPVNTNDASSREFQLVEEYGFQVSAPRAPPDAFIEVSLMIQPGLEPPTALRVVAPLMFNFSENCLVYGGDYILACSPGNPFHDGRRTALLTCREGGIRVPLQDVRISVRTPEEAPVNKAWFIEGLDVLSEQQLGWGEALGLDVTQMSDAAVIYPGVPDVQARMVWRFRSQVLVEAGGYLQLTLPADELGNLAPNCAGTNFEILALPYSEGCHVQDAGNVIIYLNSTMVPSEYAFAIRVSPPAVPPRNNHLSIRLRDRTGQVRDAAVALPGIPIQEKLRLRALDLQWTASRPSRPSTVTIGFEALDPLPDLVVAPIQQVSEILITLPVGFTQLVDTVTDFTAVNEDMPFASPTWLDFMQRDRLRIMLDLNRTAWTTLKAGTYTFRFDVLIPDPLPVFNVWYLSLCKPNFPGGCTRIADPGVLITWAIPGFALNQAPAAGYGVAAHASGLFPWRTPSGPLRVLMLLSLAFARPAGLL